MHIHVQGDPALHGVLQVVEDLPLQPEHADAGESGTYIIGHCLPASQQLVSSVCTHTRQAILHSEEVVKKTTLEVWRVRTRKRVRQLTQEVCDACSWWAQLLSVVAAV